MKMQYNCRLTTCFVYSKTFSSPSAIHIKLVHIKFVITPTKLIVIISFQYDTDRNNIAHYHLKFFQNYSKVKSSHFTHFPHFPNLVFHGCSNMAASTLSTMLCDSITSHWTVEPLCGHMVICLSSYWLSAIIRLQ